MARHSFGGDIAAYTISAGTANAATLVGGATITFFDSVTGGSQYTDLAADSTGVTGINFVTSQDGSGGTSIGQIPQFWGPDGIVAMWASANGGPRTLMEATDTAAIAAANATAVGATQAQLTSHIAAPNPHSTRVQDLSDASITTTPTDGYVFTYEAATGKWKAKAATGGGGGTTGAALLASANTFTAANTFGPLANVNASRVLLYADATGQVADMLQCYSGTDTGAGGARQKTMYLNEKGELRVIAAAANSVGVRIKGQTGQTAHITEWTDIGNSPISWVEPNGSMRAPNLSVIPAFSVAGALTVQSGAHRWYNITGVPLTIRAVLISVTTAPTGAAILVDINVNGTTIFTTQANRPSIAASAFASSKVVTMNTTTMNDGDYLTADIDQIGSTVAGSNLTVQVLAY